MNKFWPLLFVTILALATWTTHYVQMTSASAGKPLATFETLSGDEAHLHDVILEGSFVNRSSYARLVVENGEVYPRTQPFLTSSYLQVFEDLKKQHRSFMRGKTNSTNQFYMHNDTIAYVNSMGEQGATHIDMTFGVKGAHNTSFTVDIPIDEKISWTTTYRLTLQGEAAYVLVNVMLENGKEALYGIELNIPEKQLVSAKKLVEVMDEGELDYFISFISESYTMQHEDYFVYVEGQYKHQYNEGDSYTHSEEVHVWNTLTNTEAVFKLPERLQAEERRIVTKGKLLLINIIRDGNIVTERYDLDAQKWLEPIVVNVSSDIYAQPYFSVTTSEQYMYTSIMTDEGTMLAIIDPNTGNTVYTGMLNESLSIFYAMEQQ